MAEYPSPKPVLSYAEEPDVFGDRYPALRRSSEPAWVGIVSSFVIRISSLFRSSRFRHSLFLCVLFPLGCTTTPKVDLTPINSRQILKVNFGRAYFAPGEGGDDKILLLSDPIDDPTESSPGDPFAVATAPPIWQVLLIQLHWRTSASPKEDQLVANNAVLHWYVYGKPTSSRVGVLHYVGSGSVTVSTDASGAEVSINHAELKLADRHGEIHDPFNGFQIKASCHASTDASKVRQSQDDVAEAIAQADRGSDGAPAPVTTQAVK